MKFYENPQISVELLFFDDVLTTSPSLWNARFMVQAKNNVKASTNISPSA